MRESYKVKTIKNTIKILQEKKEKLQRELTATHEELIQVIGTDKSREVSLNILQTEAEWKAVCNSLENSEERLKAQLKLENSKEYINMLKDMNQVEEHARERAEKWFHVLQELTEEAESIVQETREHDKLVKETGTFSGVHLRMVEPFSTMRRITARLKMDFKDIKGGKRFKL